MTRKFLVAFFEQGIRKTKKKEFLIPNLNQFDNYFIGIDTGEICQYGFVVYTGVELSPSMVIEKLLKNNIITETSPEIENTLMDYLQFIKNCKISEVLEIKYESGKYKYNVTGLRMKQKTSKIP